MYTIVFKHYDEIQLVVSPICSDEAIEVIGQLVRKTYSSSLDAVFVLKGGIICVLEQNRHEDVLSINSIIEEAKLCFWCKEEVEELVEKAKSLGLYEEGSLK